MQLGWELYLCLFVCTCASIYEYTTPLTGYIIRSDEVVYQLTTKSANTSKKDHVTHSSCTATLDFHQRPSYAYIQTYALIWNLIIHTQCNITTLINHSRQLCRLLRVPLVYGENFDLQHASCFTLLYPYYIHMHFIQYLTSLITVLCILNPLNCFNILPVEFIFGYLKIIFLYWRCKITSSKTSIVLKSDCTDLRSFGLKYC